MAEDSGATVYAENITLSSPSTPKIQLTDTTNTCVSVLKSGNTSAIVGTTSNHAFRIDTNDTAAITIDTNQFVGIGNDSPATPLEVTGEILCGAATASGAKAIFGYNGDSTSGAYSAVFAKANPGGALNVEGQSSGVDDIMKVGNTSGSWGGTNMIKMENALNGATSEYFIQMDTGDETPEAYIRCDGTFAGAGSYGGGADYAEFFESSDGSVLPVGSTVVLDGDKIRLAKEGENPIGVVRPNSGSAMIGNSPMSWHGHFKKDDYGVIEYEDYTMFEWEEDGEIIKEAVEAQDEVLDDDGNVVKKAVEAKEAEYEINFIEYESTKVPEGVTVPDNKKIINKSRRIVSDDYDSSQEYQTRENRDEWHVVGLLGQIPITKGQPTGNWIKMKDVSDTVEMYFVK
jgi:hypothetical protein